METRRFKFARRYRSADETLGYAMMAAVPGVALTALGASNVAGLQNKLLIAVSMFAILFVVFALPFWLPKRRREKLEAESWLEVADGRLRGRAPNWRGLKLLAPLNEIDMPLSEIAELRRDYDVYRDFCSIAVYERWSIVTRNTEAIPLEVSNYVSSAVARAQRMLGVPPLATKNFHPEGLFGGGAVLAISAELSKPLEEPIYRKGGEKTLSTLLGRGMPDKALNLTKTEGEKLLGRSGKFTALSYLLIALPSVVILALLFAFVN